MARSPTTSDAFNAVAEPRRRQILDLLARGERPVNDVVASLGLAQPQVSKHLRVLREVGLVSVRGAGQQRLYQLNAERLKPIHDWVRTFERFWDHQLDRIKERAERMANERAGGTGPTRQGEMSMATNIVEQEIQTIHIVKEIEIAAPLEIAFEAVLEELGPASEMPDGKPFPMVIEPWPGGRWYRDLGNNAGHFWGHVQVIKPPTLLELCGPMFMSYPAVNHVQYRLTAEGDGTRLKFTHRGVRARSRRSVWEGVGQGWDYGLKRIREIAERLKHDRG